ncbi:hypothetical protein [uncultured Paludibaculum sp.]|uniref:hypothetical protein n=1 Tax=uncultured Paludibaculum sp. TaxID=1765020 RepID=UPI002AAC26F9|nr:hypothetical protein [uncultured Paludibaculum sp.]
MLPRELERQSVLIEKIGSFPAGVPVEFTTTARRKVQGGLGPVTDDAVHLNTSNGETVWMFDEIRSVRRLDRRGFGVVHRLLALLLATVCGLSAADLRSKALDIPNGAKVEIQTNAREKIAGLLRGVAEEGITVEIAATHPGPPRLIAFEDIKSLKWRRGGVHPIVGVAFVLGILMGISALIGG